MNVLGKALAGAALLFPLLAAGATPARAPELAAILADLSRHATVEQYEQIVRAIDAAPPLAARLEILARAGTLTGIAIVAKPSGLPFDATVAGPIIRMSPSLLMALRQQRSFDIAHGDDVLPYNTVFVLAHLVDHLENPAAAPGKGTSREAWIDGRLRAEATAFLDAWNVTVDEATRRNRGQPLTPGQVGTLLLNLRYRFAFLGPGQNGAPGLPFEPGGAIAIDEASVRLVVDHLKSSRITDIE